MTTFKKIQENAEELTRARNERCEPIAKKIYQVIANSNISFVPAQKDSDRKEFVNQYDALIKEILNELKSSNIPLNEWTYVTQLALVPFEHIKTYISESLNLNINTALTYLWGKDEKELTLQDVEDVLKKSIAKE